MTRFVVLLRGVNVGKGRRLPMADFKALLQGLGYTEVVTVLNSGNAVFSAPGRSADRHAQAIAAALAASMGVAVAVVVLSATDFAGVVADNPLSVDESAHARFLVAFAQAPSTLGGLVDALQNLIEPPEQLAVGPRAAYLHCAAGILESAAGAALLGASGRAVTTRNWGTVLKLRDRLGGR